MVPAEFVDPTGVGVTTPHLYWATRGQHAMIHYSHLSILEMQIVQKVESNRSSL